MCECVCVHTCAHAQSLSHIHLFATPWTVAHQPLVMGCSKREYWSGLPFPTPMKASPIKFLHTNLHSALPKIQSLPPTWDTRPSLSHQPNKQAVLDASFLSINRNKAQRPNCQVYNIISRGSSGWVSCASESSCNSELQNPGHSSSNAMKQVVQWQQRH